MSSILLFCGMSLTLAAAVPVCGQTSESRINKKPLEDFVQTVKTKRVDWTKPFSVEVEGVLTKDGKLDRAAVTGSEGDKELIEVARQAIAAVGESGWLVYLRNQGVEKIKISAAQTAETFSVTMFTEQPTVERAKTVASSFNAMLAMARMIDRNGVKKLGEDEKKLLSSAKVTGSEKTVNIVFTMPASEFRELIRRRMEESKA